MASLTPRHRWMVSQVVAVFGLADHEPTVERLFKEQFAPKVEPFLKGMSTNQHLLFSYQGCSDPAAPSADITGKLTCSGETGSGKI